MAGGARRIGCPENVLRWIPWIADGSLSGRQISIVVAHATECIDCRDELDIVSGADFELEAGIPDAERVFESILKRIRAAAEADRESGAKPVVSPDAG